MRTVLLTGFEPFAGESVNPSWEAVRRLADWECRGHRVVVHRIPCVFGAALTALERTVALADPVAVLGVGQAQSRADVSVERVAINLDDARIPDNAGRQPIDEPVVPGGPDAYFASLPVKAIVAAVQAAGLPASVSQTAGTFVCNHLFYGACHLRARHRPTMRVGFIHVPLSPEQAARHPGSPSMSVDSVAAALRIAVDTVLATRTDSRIAGGRLD
ncbi:pyroglutamyl-peptidase I [Azospirillum agricola]|uniref:pyroglutamyl-peptidase I n=1 Tax=Azospirillum agricola TaxID=1720247 RepID=UPI000A0F3507|nr:pyroglutamyl-peptidase I [Azospirillum agricola]SMH34885.1 pyroglutamyl-peptidase I . Cysteine peptidase. MEROPS family C15 [Azospirillum lipoferum]